PRGDRGRAQQPGLGRALLGFDHGVRGHRASAVRRRFLRDDLLPDHLRARRPERRSRAAGPGDLRGPGAGPLAPALRRLAQRAGRHARHVRRDRHLRRRTADRDPVSPRGRVHSRRPVGRPASAPGTSRGRAAGAQAGGQGRRRPAAAGQLPAGQQAAEPAGVPGSGWAVGPAGPQARRGRTRTRVRAGLPPRRPAEHRRRTRHHGRAGSADRGAARGRAARRAGGDHPAPGGGPGAEQAGGAPFGTRAAGQRPGRGAGHRAADGGQGAPHRGADGAAVYGLAVVVTHSADMTRAGAYAAAAAVAWYALGPGSGSPRRQLNRMAGAVARTRISAAVITLSVWALAVAAVLFAASQAPYYWPAVDPHLPSLHHLVMSASDWLLRNTHL